MTIGRGSLLKRLKRGEEIVSSRPSSSDFTSLHDDIIAHLQVLLNSRQGNSLTVPDFGLLDFSDVMHALPRSMSVLEQEIRATIEHYEPRLCEVQVRHVVPEQVSLDLHFEIMGRLKKDPKRTLHVKTRVASGGHFYVEGT